MGLYLSGHPLDLHAERIRGWGRGSLSRGLGRAGAFPVAGPGAGDRWASVATPEGTMAFFTLEDKTGEAEVVVRPKVWRGARAARGGCGGPPGRVDGAQRWRASPPFPWSL
ncbi:MAG: hypothetical protein ABDI20_07230 [Candidatus Bipolaricaulaceae bacterium]